MNQDDRKLIDDFIKFVTALALETGTSPADAMQLEMVLETAAGVFSLQHSINSLMKTFPIRMGDPDESGDQPGT